MAEYLFRYRGWILGAVALAFVVAADPSGASLWAGAAVSLVGLLLRLWAISWIGPAARTRDTRAPSVRVTGGPYRLRHPLYVANVLVAAGFAWACRPSLTQLTVGVAAVTAFYLVLAGREEKALAVGRVPDGVRPRLTLRKTLRTERSTWAGGIAGYALLVALLLVG